MAASEDLSSGDAATGGQNVELVSISRTDAGRVRLQVDVEGSDPRDVAWVSTSSPEGGGTHIQVTRRDDRWVVTGIYMHAPEVTMTALQAAPVSLVNLSVNLLPSLFANMQESGLIFDNPTLFADDPSLADLREQAQDAPPALRPIAQPLDREGRPKLTRPDGSDPDAFYRQVALAYAQYAPQTRAPAVEIAKEAGVPVGTARGWVREARRRGHLRPGRQGKVG